MSTILPDNTVLQDGLRFNHRPENPGVDLGKIFYPVRAQVLNAYYPDDQENPFGETILCDLHCASLGIHLYRVPFSLEKASVDNYISYGPSPATGNVDKSPFQKMRVDPKKSTGDTVLVVFIEGSVKDPMIVKTVPHNQSGIGGVSPSPREGRAAGDHYKVRFNGTNLVIDKDGNFILDNTKTFDEAIPRNKRVQFTIKDPEKTQKVDLLLDNTLNATKAVLSVVKESGDAQTVTLDGEAQTIKVENKSSAGANAVTMDSAGVAITVTGKAVIQTTGNTEVQADGEVVVTAAGKVEVTGSEITLNGMAGNVLTTETDRFVDLITGTPTVGVPTVKAG